MKKFVFSLLAFAVIVPMAFLMTGCGGNGGGTPPEPTQLNAPINLRIENNKLSWNAVENTNGYSVALQIDGANGLLPIHPQPIAITNTPYIRTCELAFKLHGMGFNLYGIDPFERTFYIRVLAIGDGINYSSSAASDRIEAPSKFPLVTPTLSIENDDLLTWSVIPFATVYTVYKNGVEWQTTPAHPALDLSSEKFAVGNYEFTVRASRPTLLPSGISNSVEIQVAQLQSPQSVNISNDGRTITWSPVKDASNYAVYVNGVRHTNQVVDAGVTTYIFSASNMNLRTLGTYDIQIRAFGNHITRVESELSPVASLVIEQLATPQNLSVGVNAITPNETESTLYDADITITWDSVQNAHLYRIRLIHSNGNNIATINHDLRIDGEELSTVLHLQQQGVVTVEITALSWDGTRFRDSAVSTTQFTI